MTADVELLPLPSWAHKADKLLCDTDWLRTQVSDYARACVAHATAAKDAEIEALRAEVAESRRKWSDAESKLAACDSDLREFQQRAERLAEALRELAAKWREPRADDDCTLYTMGKRSARLGCSLDLAIALHPTAAQENDDA